MTVGELQRLFVYHKPNTKLNTVEGYGREWALADLAEHLHVRQSDIRPLLTRENGFFQHGGQWEYNPLGGELARLEALTGD